MIHRGVELFFSEGAGHPVRGGVIAVRFERSPRVIARSNSRARKGQTPGAIGSLPPGAIGSRCNVQALPLGAIDESFAMLCGGTEVALCRARCEPIERARSR